MTATVTPPRYVGKRMLRVEDPSFLRGQAQFVDDVDLPGLLHAAFLRSPFAHARIRSIDAGRAREARGVHAVLTGADVGDAGMLVTTIATRPDEVETGVRRLLPTDKARHVGDPVAVVVARSRYLAEDACDLIEVDWEPLPAVVDAEEALAEDAPVIHEELGGNRFAHIEFERGDVEGLFDSAAHLFAKRFHFGRTFAAPLETRGVVGQYEQGPGELIVWTSTQFPHLVRTSLAPLLELPENRVRVIAPAVGGGFGLKVQIFVEEVLIPLLALRLGRPVKWIEDRREALVASGHAKELICDLEAAVGDDGRFLAFRGRYVGDAGAYQAHPWTGLIDPLCAASFLPGQYGIEAVRYEADVAITNKCPSTAYRGVGWTPGQAAREAMIDDIARALGRDPLELRIQNTISEEPGESLTGCRYDGGSYVRAQEKAAEMLDYARLRERQRRLRDEGRYLGIGFSPFVEQGGWAAAVARANGFPGYAYMDSVNVTVEPDASVTVTSGFHSHGQGHHTALAQVVADRLGVPFDAVRIVQGDTAGTAYSTGTYGSRTAVVAGGALVHATGDIRDKLLRIAAHTLEANPDDLELADGRISVRGDPTHSLSIAEVVATAYSGAGRPTDIEVSLTSTRSYDPPETYSNACIAAVVEVDVETGAVEIERMVVVEDCGTILNPMIVDGQIAGALAQGVGAALYEALPYDEEGQPLAPTLREFTYPSTLDVPPLDIAHIETPSPVTANGAKGMGEGGTIGAPAACVNAVADALSPFGVSVDFTPLRPAAILSLLREARERSRA